LGKGFVVGVFVGLLLVLDGFILDSALGVCVELIEFVDDLGSDGPPSVGVV
jgi:hypothetical protein